ncbi:MAG: hypothetical protein JF619_00275 [Massilia sp.]|nr:hypothetical protein [Massilia sp.]
MDPGGGLLEFEQQQAEGQAHGQEETDPLAQALAPGDQVVERVKAGRTASGYGLSPEAMGVSMDLHWPV